MHYRDSPCIFQMGGSLFKEEKLSRFYKKRAISILTLYYFVHFAWILLNRQDFIKGLLLAPVELLGLQSVFTSVFGVLHNGGTWFISCIIISYFLFPLVHEIIQRSSFRTRFILLCLCIFIIRYMPYYATISGSMSLYTNPFYRTIEFIMGMLLASLKFNNNREGKEENKKKNIYYTIIVIISSFILLSGFHFHYKFIEDNSVILACIIIFCSSKIRCWRLSNSKCLIYASQLTYGFYILQLFVWTPSLKIIEFLNIGDNKFDFLVALFLLCFVCVIIHELYEKPLQRYLRKKI